MAEQVKREVELPPLDITEREWEIGDQEPPWETIGHLQCRERQLTAALQQIAEAKDLLMFAEFNDSDHLTRYDRWLSSNS